MKTSTFIATSLDGLIARRNGELDWLGEPTVEGEDFGYAEFMQSVDCLVMGRNTYEKVLSFGDWPYSKPVVVLTRRALEIPTEIADRVEPMAGSPVEILEMLTQRGLEHLYIDGGKTIQGFLNAGLLQRIIVTQIPVLLGEGIPLFGPLISDIELQHIKTRTFPDGKVQSEYRVVS